MSAEPKGTYTLEEYLELERTSDLRYEYWNGEIFAMSGGTLGHERVMRNTYDSLRNRLQGKSCEVFSNNMQIKVPAAFPYRYADISVVCGKIEIERFNGNDLLLNPVLLVEVLSPSTEAFDRGDKFSFYKSIPALKNYLLLAQHRPHATLFVKQSATEWIQTEANDLTGSLYVPSIDGTLHLSEIFQNVEFETPPQQPHLPSF